MTRFSRFDEKGLDRLFSGISPEGPLDDLTAFLRGVRASCAQSPTEDVVGQHLASISESIRDGRSETRPLVDRSFVTHASLWRRAMNKTVSAALRVGAGVVAASMSMIGLAYAGVDLPRQAPANAIEAVTGLELPNQDRETDDELEIDRSVSDDVRAVIESRESYATGCEFGRAVAAAATQNSQGQGDPQAKDCHSDEAEATGTARGKAKASDARSDNSASAKARASERSQGASDARSDNSASAKARASERSKKASDARSGNAVGRSPRAADSPAAAGGTESNAQGGR